MKEILNGTKLLLLSIAIAQLGFAPALAEEACESCAQIKASMAAIEEQILKVACETEKIAEKILKAEEQVPSRIYHYGKKQYMMENVAARTIPQKAWDKYIMGGKTRFALNPVRRGLYGTAGVDTNGFGGSEYNWMIEIQIKEECRAQACCHAPEPAYGPSISGVGSRQSLGKPSRRLLSIDGRLQGFQRGIGVR